MECSLIDKNALSIISSPNKHFYYMAGVEWGEQEPIDNNYRITDDVVDDSTSYTITSDFPSFDQASRDSLNNCICDNLEEHSCEVAKSVTPEWSSDASASDVCNKINLHSSDALSDSLSVDSETVFDADATDYRTHDICEHQLDLEKNVVRALSLAELFNPVYIQKVHHKSEGHLNFQLENSRRSPRRSVCKSRSFQNNSSSSCKNGKHNPYEGVSSTVRKKLRFASENVFHRNSTNKHNNCWRSHVSISRTTAGPYSFCDSDNTEESESSGSEGENPTSDYVSSTCHESAAIDQAWDRYQVPLYVAISDDSGEEKLDATGLQEDWQQMTDDFTDFSDFANVNGGHQPPLPSEPDSDTDAEELLHLIKESSDALCLTRLSLADLKARDKTQRSSFLEPLATCQTNLRCLTDLLDVVGQKDQLTDGDKDQLLELLKQWKDVESEFLQLTDNYQDLSMLKSANDVVIDLSPDDSTLYPETHFCSSEGPMKETRSTNPNGISFGECFSSIFKRCDIFSYKISNLTKDTSQVLQSTVTSVNTIFFLMLLFLLITYLLVYSKCWVTMMEIRIDPQLRYVIGPPPT